MRGMREAIDAGRFESFRHTTREQWARSDEETDE
jgi:queuine/archaeosine tRNA-ribosyltransferase